jgi:hypothetical protein
LTPYCEFYKIERSKKKALEDGSANLTFDLVNSWRYKYEYKYLYLLVVDGSNELYFRRVNNLKKSNMLKISTCGFKFSCSTVRCPSVGKKKTIIMNSVKEKAIK